MNTPTSTAPKPFVFVLMPFDPGFDDVYQLGIKEAANAAGAHCERVDEQIFDEAIMERVYNQIAKADLIIAEMTGRNPNVFYETGYAHALGKRVILVTRRAEDIPFDLKHFPHVVHGGRISELRSEIERRVRWAVEHPTQSLTVVEPLLEFYHDRIPLEKQIVTKRANQPGSGGHTLAVHLELSIHNSGRRTYRSDLARIGILFPPELPTIHVFGQPSVTLPDGSRIFFLDMLGNIFPDAWDRLFFSISGHVREPLPMEAELRLRIYSEVTTRDIPFTLRVG